MIGLAFDLFPLMQCKRHFFIQAADKILIGPETKGLKNTLYLNVKGNKFSFKGFALPDCHNGGQFNNGVIDIVELGIFADVFFFEPVFPDQAFADVHGLDIW